MYYRQAITLKELSDVMTDKSEFFFIIDAQLQQRKYRVAVYKYDNEYFLLQDPRLFDRVYRMNHRPVFGDAEELLAGIEIALEDNLYFKVKEDLIQLDVEILKKMNDDADIAVQCYEIIDEE